MSEEVTGRAASPRRRASGRGTGTARTAISTAKYRALHHRFPPSPVLSEDELESIHNTSLTVLEEMGIDFMHEAIAHILAVGI